MANEKKKAKKVPRSYANNIKFTTNSRSVYYNYMSNVIPFTALNFVHAK
jgi:hypothetical protein